MEHIVNWKNGRQEKHCNINIKRFENEFSQIKLDLPQIKRNSIFDVKKCICVIPWIAEKLNT